MARGDLVTARRFAPRPGYRDLVAYRSAAGNGIEFDLGDNTNLFGSAPSARAAAAAWAGGDPAKYPSPAADDLRHSLGDWLGVRPEEILGGCGSNDVLDSALRALVEPGARVAFAAPTFVMTGHFAAANSLVPVPVPVSPDGQPDVDALVRTGAPVIYLASPNNPTGVATTGAALDCLLDRAPYLVILDEAYIEFAGPSRAQEAVGRGNVLVTRTFSKVWGLAGLRLGYGIASARLIEEIEKARGPFKVNALAERAAAAAVRDDRAWLRDIVLEVRGARADLVDRLRGLGLSPFRSEANFVGVPVPDARRAADFLARRGVAVRAFVGAPGLGDLLRITVGPPAACDAVIGGLRELLTCG
jgi:histidinol-phosphate aminotransferase